MQSNHIKVSVVIPCLNEENTIAETINNVKEGFSIAGINGEIIIVDSSTDNSSKIATELGAKVISVPKRGLGHAYIDAIPHISGNYVIMGDADCTYDFREINKFINKLDEGFEFVMGTRMKGYIEKGAMPALHRYFGTPLTTWILNTLLGTNFSDIHCGLRAITLDGLEKIDIQSKSWEYASEMVVKGSLLKLKNAEVPIHFYKDKYGRVSHHKRQGWFSPWHAGWINLKVMLLYVPDKMIIQPGILFLLIGLSLILMQVNGPLNMGFFTFSTNTMMLGLTLAVLGFSSIQMGILVSLFSHLHKYINNKITRFFYSAFSYTRAMILGVLTSFGGLVLASTLIYQWFENGCKLIYVPWYVVFGLFLLIFGIQTTLFNLVCQAFLLTHSAGENS